MSRYNTCDFVCFDLETTGLSIYNAEIIEIAAVKVRNWEITECFTSFVKPVSPIPCNITNITGITNGDVADAPEIYEVLPDFLEFIGDDILVGHDIARFDMPILKRFAKKQNLTIDNDYIDTLELSRSVLPNLKNHTNENLCSYYGIVNEEAHRALSDSKATAEVYKAMILNADGDESRVVTSKKSGHYFRSAVSEQTQALISLKGILAGITCDNILTESEVLYLKGWLDNNTCLKGNFPFDLAYSEVNKALEDGILEQHELDHMLNVFVDFLNPVESKSEHCNTFDFNEKTICLSGEFEKGSKNEVTEILTSAGATVVTSVIKKVDYLIVGGCGSDAWSCGNYGTKVKKALEMQAKGHCIKILKECEALTPQSLDKKEKVEQLSFLSDEANIEDNEIEHEDFLNEEIKNTERTVKNIFEIVSNISGFDLKLFKLTPNLKDKNKDTEKIIGYSLYLDTSLMAKINANLTIIYAHNKTINSIPKVNKEKLKRVSNPIGFYKYKCDENESGEAFLEHVLQIFVENFIPQERFGCCHRYVECSDARECTAPDKYHARGCYYRENLEKGKIFYGKNANN